jgi:hypothetical protein
MGRPTPETGGGASQNQGLSEFKSLSKERGVGWGVKKSEQPKQQPSDPNREAFERFLRSTPMRPAVFEGLPSSRPNRQIKDEDNRPKPLNYSHEPVDVHTAQLQKEGRLRPEGRNSKEIFRVFYGKPPEGEVPGDASKYLSDPHFSGFVRRGRMRPAVYGGHVHPNKEPKPQP